MKRFSEFFETTAGLFTAIALVLLSFTTYGVVIYLNYFRHDPATAGSFGDMFGGVNAFFTACTVLLVFYAARLQKKELDATRDEFRQQNETTKLQRFETTFFNLVTLYNQIKKELFLWIPHEDIPEDFVKVEGSTVFVYAQEYVHSLLRSGGPKALEYTHLYEKPFSDWYKSGVNREKEIPHYYNHIMNTFTFIKDSELTPEQTKFYCKTFYSLFSPTELGLIFYHVGLNIKLDQNLKFFIVDQKPFESIYGIQILSHHSHWHINYPKVER